MKSYRIGNLPEELEHEILLRLPVKVLLVCKCVCKVWCALIKSSSFINRHFNHKRNERECLFFHLDINEQEMEESYAFVKYQDDERHSLVEEPYHLRQIPTDIFLMGLEKGIFCVMSIVNNRLGLLNPATRECKTLPPHPLHDPLAPCPHIGFGLDSSNGDFKVVVFTSYRLSKLAFVYNFSCDSWKIIETMDLLDKLVSCRPMGVQGLNGVNHWLVTFADHDVYSILAFDMRSEKFQEITIPDALGKTERCLKLTAYCDSVAVMSYNGAECVDLWVMGRDGLWSKIFSIGPFQENVWPSCVWKNEVFLDTSSSNLIISDISTQKVRTLIIPRAETYPEYSLDLPLSYKESLVSIKGDKDDCLQDLCTDYHL